MLEPRDDMRAVRGRALEIFAAANEEPGGFQVTSPYVVAALRRG